MSASRTPSRAGKASSPPRVSRAAQRVEERLWNAVSVTRDLGALSDILASLLPDGRVEVVDDVPTARIRREGEHHVIQFGREFLRRELSAPADLLFVFLHEVYHHVRGHLMAGRHAQADWPEQANIAADMVVNRAVSERFVDGRSPLLLRLNDPRALPGCLLVPPASRSSLVAETGFLERLAEGGVTGDVARSAADVYYAGWFDDVPFDRLFELVVSLSRALGGMPKGRYVLLGDHGSGGFDGEGFPWDGGSDGWGDGGELEDCDAGRPNRPVASPVLVEAVRQALESDPSHPRRWTATTSGTTVLPFPGRTDIALLAAGHLPALFHGPRPDIVDDGQRTRLYLDVSGSVEPVLPHLFGLVLALPDEFAPVIHVFSTEVADLSLAGLAAGRFESTGGTHFDCVLQHAVAVRARRVLVVTDGVGPVSPRAWRRFATTGGTLYILLTGSRKVRSWQMPVLAVATKWWVLA